MSRFLVIGGTGFVGAHVVSALAAKGHDVIVAGRKSPGPDCPASFLHLDVLTDDLESKLYGVEAGTLVHLAWVTEHGAYWRSPENADWLDASTRLFKAFVARGGRRVVATGTCAEYSPSAAPLKETAATSSEFQYGVAKGACRGVLERLAKEGGFSAAWARLFFPYGPGEDPRRLVPSVILNLLRKQEAPCSSGTQVRDFMYAEDMGAAIADLAIGPVRGAVNIGSGTAVEVGRVAQSIGELMGRPDLVRLGALPDRPNEIPHIVADIDRLRFEVGFVPETDLRTGLTKAIQYWRGQRENQ